ncbi:hypothetical protein BS50DRAFT_674371 [Corynespora cassiicola Philippines]|uniref:Uncharacterized protein n=1 Tax=Corynespora cassiicola Philippines TaxID=1448308 RepID=A0A2T2NWQ5_CORCC|nr:hypothetical protein BS50DRAFT_674371 [Corynespora cassiicola Philippines]
MSQHLEHLEGSGESSLLASSLPGFPPFISPELIRSDIQDAKFENGATQVIVSLHKWPETAIRGTANRSLCSTCEISKDDAVFIIGSIWHGGGENKTDPSERRV